MHWVNKYWTGIYINKKRIYLPLYFLTLPLNTFRIPSLLVVILFKKGPIQICSSAPHQESKSDFQKNSKDYFDKHFHVTEGKNRIGRGKKASRQG